MLSSLWDRIALLGVVAVIASVLVILLYGWAGGDPSPRLIEADGPHLGLMMSPELVEAQQAGGTWTDVVDDDGWPARLPVLAWLVVVEGIALLGLPLGFLLFRSLPDRGFLLTKVLALLLVCFVVWLLASLRWMAFSPASIAIAIAGLASVSALVASRRRDKILSFVRRRWPVLLVSEVLFLAAFLAFLAVRMANPDLWHPHFGGEKPMDLAYLTAVARSTYMPPYDPWFAGGYMNYYYWGHFVVATLVRATGIATSTAYNLAVPLFFALTAGAAYSLAIQHDGSYPSAPVPRNLSAGDPMAALGRRPRGSLVRGRAGQPGRRGTDRAGGVASAYSGHAVRRVRLLAKQPHDAARPSR